MVRTEDLGVDLRVHHPLRQSVGEEEVVDAPPGVLLARMESVRPPGVGHLRGVEAAEGVGEATFEQRRHLFALLVGEARVAAVGLRILDIDLLVGHIEVATDDDGLLAVQPVEIGLKVGLPLHAVGEAAQLVLGVGRIDADQEKVGHLQREDAPLVVVDLDTYALGDAQRLVAREDGRAAISLLLRRVPVGLIAGEGQVELALLHLRLLQADEVGVELGKGLLEALADTGAQPVDIPRDQFHGGLLSDQTRLQDLVDGLVVEDSLERHRTDDDVEEHAADKEGAVAGKRTVVGREGERHVALLAVVGDGERHLVVLAAGQEPEPVLIHVGAVGRVASGQVDAHGGFDVGDDGRAVEVLSVAAVEAVGDDPQRQVLDHHERVVGRDGGRDHGRVLVAADVVVVLEVGPAFVHTLHVAQLGGTLLGREVGSRTILTGARVGSGLEVVVIATGGQADEDHANGQEA